MTKRRWPQLKVSVFLCAEGMGGWLKLVVGLLDLYEFGVKIRGHREANVYLFFEEKGSNEVEIGRCD